MKHLLVHIGTGKTGSTAIQQALQQSAQQLRSQGVHYWGLNLEGAENTSPFPWQKEGGTSDLQKLSDAVAARELEQALIGALERLPDGATAVWSNESIYERPGAYLSLLQSIQSEQVKCTVIAYARSHRAYISSAYKQWGIKHKTYPGPVLGFSDWVKARQNFLSYGTKLARWDAAFGEFFRLVNYDAIQDVVGHFSSYLPEGTEVKPGSSNRVNQSPSPAVLAMYALHNNQFSDPVTPEKMVALLRQFPQLRKIHTVPSFDSLFPDDGGLDAAEKIMQDDCELVDSMLRRHGQPTLTKGKSNLNQSGRSTEQVTGDLLAALLQMIIELNTRVIQLEQGRPKE
jgi:hypothetical protein